ncbi:hypothetical protein Cfor_00758 [Coptotermes formosanus]|uniref:Nose resistant-to-fluoxetine protein N-terminal domain-containing protein n=1 Tax=Coptotermes formosanus TaxID=36987 RepID=A0A6L2PHB8_COPFO|nr:hypothetical protein Cfor_00758 [Coptotermes formosanus]
MTMNSDAFHHLQPGHRVPRYSAIHWALCVPASCNASDVQVALSDTLHRHTEGTGIGFNVRVTDSMCQTQDDRLHLPSSTIVVGAIFIIIAGFAVVATVCDPTWRSVDQKLILWTASEGAELHTLTATVFMVKFYVCNSSFAR